MPPPSSSRLRELASAVRRTHAGSPTPGDRDLLRRTAATRLAGGRNNAVWAAELEGHRVCLTLYRPDERDRAGREWSALRVLARHASGLAPLPYLVDRAAPPPLVAMELLPGRPLGGRLDPGRLAALAESHAALHRITPAVAEVPLASAVGQPAALIARAGALLEPRGAVGRGAEPPLPEAIGLWRRWSTGPDRERLRAAAPPVFGRGDPNLANSLWDGARVAIVDLENAGWTDRAVDLADLVEHAGARGTPDDDWASLVAGFGLDPREHARLLAARHMFAFFWLALSLRAGQVPPPTVEPSAQLERVRTLLEGS